MPVDTSIYGQIRPFTIADPLETQAKVMQLKASGMQIRDAERKFQLEDDLSGALAESGGDLSKASTLLAQRGRGTASLQVLDKAVAQKKEQALTLQADQTRFAGLAKELREDLARVNDDAGLAAHRQAILSMAGSFSTPQFQQMLTKMAAGIPDRLDQNWKLTQLRTADQVIARLTPKVEVKDTGAALQPWNVNPEAGPVGPLAGSTATPKSAPPAGPTDLARYQDELAAMGPDDPRRADHQRVIAGFKAGRGDTNVTVTQTGPMLPGKTAAGKIDEGLLDATQGLMRLDTIASQFKPEFQTIMTRGTQWWSGVKEKMGADLKVKEKKDLEEFSAYKRNAIDSLNQYIKMITGAAMSEQEAQRILRGMPNPGQGLFDGDSPTEFKAKLDDAMKQTKMAVARSAYLKRQGMSLEDGLGKGVSLDRMPSLMNERGRALEAQFKQDQPDASDAVRQRAVRRQLAVEFGLASD